MDRCEECQPGCQPSALPCTSCQPGYYQRASFESASSAKEAKEGTDVALAAFRKDVALAAFRKDVALAVLAAEEADSGCASCQPGSVSNESVCSQCADSVEVMVYHHQSRAVARLSWDDPICFARSWQATLFIMAAPLPYGLEWIKVVGPFIPTHTLAEIYRKAAQRLSYTDPNIEPFSAEDRRVKNILLEL